MWTRLIQTLFFIFLPFNASATPSRTARLSARTPQKIDSICSKPIWKEYHFIERDFCSAVVQEKTMEVQKIIREKAAFVSPYRIFPGPASLTLSPWFYAACSHSENLTAILLSHPEQKPNTPYTGTLADIQKLKQNEVIPKNCPLTPGDTALHVLLKRQDSVASQAFLNLIIEQKIPFDFSLENGEKISLLQLAWKSLSNEFKLTLPEEAFQNLLRDIENKPTFYLSQFNASKPQLDILHQLPDFKVPPELALVLQQRIKFEAFATLIQEGRIDLKGKHYTFRLYDFASDIRYNKSKSLFPKVSLFYKLVEQKITDPRYYQVTYIPESHPLGSNSEIGYPVIFAALFANSRPLFDYLLSIPALPLDEPFTAGGIDLLISHRESKNSSSSDHVIIENFLPVHYLGFMEEQQKFQILLQDPRSRPKGIKDWGSITYLTEAHYRQEKKFGGASSEIHNSNSKKITFSKALRKFGLSSSMAILKKFE